MLFSITDSSPVSTICLYKLGSKSCIRTNESFFPVCYDTFVTDFVYWSHFQFSLCKENSLANVLTGLCSYSLLMCYTKKTVTSFFQFPYFQLFTLCCFAQTHLSLKELSYIVPFPFVHSFLPLFLLNLTSVFLLPFVLIVFSNSQCSSTCGMKPAFKSTCQLQGRCRFSSFQG